MSDGVFGGYPVRPQQSGPSNNPTQPGQSNAEMQVAVVALQNAATALNGIIKELQDGLDTSNTQLTDIVTELTAINTTLNKVLPLGTAVVSSSSGSSGKFLAYTAPDGTQYVIPLDLP